MAFAAEMARYTYEQMTRYERLKTMPEKVLFLTKAATIAWALEGLEEADVFGVTTDAAPEYVWSTEELLSLYRQHPDEVVAQLSIIRTKPVELLDGLHEGEAFVDHLLGLLRNKNGAAPAP